MCLKGLLFVELASAPARSGLSPPAPPPACPVLPALRPGRLLVDWGVAASCCGEVTVTDGRGGGGGGAASKGPPPPRELRCWSCRFRCR